MSFDRSTLFSCEGLVAVITGGGSGLGAYTARALDANGAKAVYLVGRRKESLENTVKQCTNGSARYIVGDVTSKESLTAVAAQVEREVGYVNVLFANSGVGGMMRSAKLGNSDYSLDHWVDTMWEVPQATFTETMHVNVTGAFYTTVAFVKLLDAGNRKGNMPSPYKSQVVLTSSVAGLSRSMSMSYDYSASKAAVIHVTKMLATQLARFKIRANTIAPGIYPSEMTSGHPSFKNENFSKEGGLPASANPLERAGSEDDFAGTVLYLMSPAGAYADGLVLLTDGGRTSIFPAVY